MNKKRYWLRGGILGFFVSIILSFYFIVDSVSITPISIRYVNGFSFEIYRILTACGGESCMGALLYLPLVYILLGISFFSVFGWLYGKVRNSL